MHLFHQSSAAGIIMDLAMALPQIWQLRFFDFDAFIIDFCQLSLMLRSFNFGQLSNLKPIHKPNNSKMSGLVSRAAYLSFKKRAGRPISGIRIDSPAAGIVAYLA